MRKNKKENRSQTDGLTVLSSVTHAFITCSIAIWMATIDGVICWRSSTTSGYNTQTDRQTYKQTGIRGWAHTHTDTYRQEHKRWRLNHVRYQIQYLVLLKWRTHNSLEPTREKRRKRREQKKEKEGMRRESNEKCWHTIFLVCVCVCVCVCVFVCVWHCLPWP